MAVLIDGAETQGLYVQAGNELAQVAGGGGAIVHNGLFKMALWGTNRFYEKPIKIIKISNSEFFFCLDDYGAETKYIENNNTATVQCDGFVPDGNYSANFFFGYSKSRDIRITNTFISNGNIQVSNGLFTIKPPTIYNLNNYESMSLSAYGHLWKEATQ